MTWRGGPQGRGEGGPDAWATACVPYHPCSGAGLMNTIINYARL